MARGSLLLMALGWMRVAGQGFGESDALQESMFFASSLGGRPNVRRMMVVLIIIYVRTVVSKTVGSELALTYDGMVLRGEYWRSFAGPTSHCDWRHLLSSLVVLRGLRRLSLSLPPRVVCRPVVRRGSMDVAGCA